uniref:Tf2-1-like SH3-like domain-containing protein n=2 Tax=Aegilops tauschii subsp. strangulata TaxID=200361 RepID=A0A453D1W1_AEGTS
MYLRCAVHDAPKQWRRWLSGAEFWYNPSHHASLKSSPFKALYGREPNLGGLPGASFTLPADAPPDEIDWANHTALLRAQLERAQARFKKQADRHRAEHAFDVGEQVLLKLQPYAQSSVANRPCKKLAFKFFGPFTVLERVGNLAYRLQLPPDSRIYPVFHVSQLKPFVPDYTPVFAELPKIPDLTADDRAPVAILDPRMMKKGNAPVVQVQVQWSSMAPSAATWEDYTVLRQRYPNAQLWADEEAALLIDHSSGLKMQVQTLNPQPQDLVTRLTGPSYRSRSFCPLLPHASSHLLSSFSSHPDPLTPFSLRSGHRGVTCRDL